MRLACLTQDGILYGHLKNNPLFKTTSLFHDLTEFESKVSDNDVLLISDHLVSCEIVPELRERFPNIAIFFMVSNSGNYRTYQKIETICHAHDAHIVYPKQTQDQIISFITGVLKPIDEYLQNNVTAFVGAQPKVGLTTTVFSVATRLGMCTDSKIGVLGLNSLNPGTLYIKEYDGAYLDELKTMLSNQMLNSSYLMNEMYKINHFFYLAGNRDIKKRLHYSIKEIHYLIEQVKKLYDLILIDAGSNYDDALCIQSLLNADTKFLVTTQQTSGFDSWKRAYEQVLEPTGFNKRDFLMIINQYRNKPHLPDAKQLAYDYGIPCLRHVTDVGELGLVVETNGNLIVDYDEPDYIKDIDFITKALIKTYRLNFRETKRAKRKGIFRKILQYGGL